MSNPRKAYEEAIKTGRELNFKIVEHAARAIKDYAKDLDTAATFEDHAKVYMTMARICDNLESAAKASSVSEKPARLLANASATLDALAKLRKREEGIL